MSEQDKKPEPQKAAPEEKADFSNLEALAGEWEPGKDGPEPGKPGEKPGTEYDMGADELAALYSLTFGLVSVRAGDHWKLSQNEASDLGQCTDAVLKKYFPHLKLGPEVALALVSLSVLAPRVAVTMAMREQEKADEEKDEKQEKKPEGAAGGNASK